MEPRRAAWLLAAGRAVIGAAMLAAPEATYSLWVGPENARGGGIRALGRGFAARDLALALASVQTLDDPVIGPRVLVAGAFADGMDALAAVRARDSLPPAGVAATVAIAGGAAAAGAYLAHRLAHES